MIADSSDPTWQGIGAELERNNEESREENEGARPRCAPASRDLTVTDLCGATHCVDSEHHELLSREASRVERASNERSEIAWITTRQSARAASARVLSPLHERSLAGMGGVTCVAHSGAVARAIGSRQLDGRIFGLEGSGNSSWRAGMGATLDNVRELGPTISQLAETVERERAIPASLLEQLKQAGVFRMYVPKSHGGDELAPMDVIHVIEEISTADASVGWLATIGTNSPAIFAFLPPETYDKIYAHGPDVIQAGSLIPRGTRTIWTSPRSWTIRRTTACHRFGLASCQRAR
jgi:hypothetical protein